MSSDEGNKPRLRLKNCFGWGCAQPAKNNSLIFFNQACNMSGIILIVLPDLQLEDLVTLRKAHPCGGNEWKVVRLGADIGLECLKCGRQVLLSRRELARRLKKIHSRGFHELKTDRPGSI